MQAAPIPANEAARLQALRELLILDTPPEERFDRICRFAAEEFEVAQVLVNLVDADRQWSKACAGAPVPELPRAVSFCAHAILGDDLMEVEDARQDPRFHDNPLALADPPVRFYAGAPLRLAHGATVGTLCLADPQPRRLDVYERGILRALRDLVVEELQRRSDEASA